MSTSHPASHIAFAGEAARRDDLLARLAAHRAAGTLDPTGATWMGRGGTPAGCIAGDADPEAFARVTGFPAALGLLLDFLCSRSTDDPTAAAAIAADWLARATPAAELARVPGEILLALLAEGTPPDEPDLAVARDAVVALHRAADAPDRAAWRRARALAVAATDGARTPSGQHAGKVIEAAAWDPLAAPSSLQDVAAAWVQARAHAASAATGWTASDDAAVERCFLACRAKSLAAGEPPEHFHFPPRLRAREPALEQRFLAQLDAANTAYVRGVGEIGRICADRLSAARAP